MGAPDAFPDMIGDSVLDRFHGACTGSSAPGDGWMGESANFPLLAAVLLIRNVRGCKPQPVVTELIRAAGAGAAAGSRPSPGRPRPGRNPARSSAGSSRSAQPRPGPPPDAGCPAHGATRAGQVGHQVPGGLTRQAARVGGDCHRAPPFNRGIGRQIASDFAPDRHRAGRCVTCPASSRAWIGADVACPTG